ncbi:MAG: RHS repeat-associated core domain-containing protein [Candidatus Omnitrophota bacterium]|nr:RHS repeat-associated core domain-containing protein [Candidatus Omnitrophota bacterium]
MSAHLKTELGNNTAVEYRYDLANRLIQLSNYKNANNREFSNANLREHICDNLRLISVNLRSKIQNLFGVKDAQTLDIVVVPPGTFSYFRYSYDKVGNRLSLRSRHYPQAEQRFQYIYDATYQLTRVLGNQTHSYDYDSVGNREVVDGTTYSANNLNQYTVVGAQSFTYDANGNLTSDGTNTYTYDVENRLTSIEHPGSSIQYQYDGFGRRIKKDVNGEVTYFIYDGDQIIEERDASGILKATYTYGTGIDEVLTMYRNAGTYYYHYDGLGSVTDITNQQGEVVESYRYDVYGLPNQTSQIGNRFYFTGRELDEESGLYYFRERYYSSIIGRFLQRDPLGTLPDINVYRYVLNNPVNYIDPYGLVIIETLVVTAPEWLPWVIAFGVFLATRNNYPPLRQVNWMPNLGLPVPGVPGGPPRVPNPYKKFRWIPPVLLGLKWLEDFWNKFRSPVNREEGQGRGKCPTKNNQTIPVNNNQNMPEYPTVPYWWDRV